LEPRTFKDILRTGRWRFNNAGWWIKRDGYLVTASLTTASMMCGIPLRSGFDIMRETNRSIDGAEKRRTVPYTGAGR
jgi:hypothetical protein